MAKPHEETWEWDPLVQSATVGRADGGIVAMADGPGIAQFIAAAPDMARALLEIREAMEDDVMDTRILGKVVDAALRKAGVLL